MKIERKQRTEQPRTIPRLGLGGIGQLNSTNGRSLRATPAIIKIGSFGGKVVQLPNGTRTAILDADATLMV